MLLTAVQLQSISHLREAPVNVTQFQLFLFILAIEVFFPLTKSKPEIEGMKIFDYNYLYSVNADDTTFFLKDITSLKHMVHTFFALFRIKTKFNKL